MIKLSININKFATLRNARGDNNPDILQVAKDCQHFGAHGITIHPRPDERHIRYNDTIALKNVIYTTYTIEGYPDKRYLSILKNVRPTQATLVPDKPNVLTSNAGWHTIQNQKFLQKVVQEIQSYGIRCIIFVEPNPLMVKGAALIGADGIELYTYDYAKHYSQKNCEEITNQYIQCAIYAQKLGLIVNAGHDLNLHNLKNFKKSIPLLNEVSIGHALVCDTLYFGLKNTIQQYLSQLN